MWRALPLLITLVASEFLTITTDNIQQVLQNQLKELEKPEKKQKGLLLCFASRSDGSLELQREI